MKTLKSYDLQRGDWVKFSSDKTWRELKEIGITDYVFDSYSYTSRYEVEAVLRPSVIIRDKLDDKLEDVRKQSHYSHMNQFIVKLTEIHPKEEKSTAELIQTIYDNKGQSSWDAVRVLAAEIDKLKEGKK